MIIEQVAARRKAGLVRLDDRRRGFWRTRASRAPATLGCTLSDAELILLSRCEQLPSIEQGALIMVIARYSGQVVFCRDVAAAADRYERFLGFRRDEEIDGDIAMRAPVAGGGEASVEIYLHPSTQPTPSQLGTFAVDDVDAAVADLAGDGWRVAEAAVDRPWGVREATLTDPEGHSLTLSAPLADASAN